MTELGIKGVWVYESAIHDDSRGLFTEWFRSDLAEVKLGRRLNLVQGNLSTSKRGVVRGIHFSVAKEGQAKWVTCISGAIYDVVVDLRPKSPTFKKWISMRLEAGSGKSIFISEGLGHAFLALEDETTISYLLTSPYSPSEELAINPRDPEIAITWPLTELHFSNKDERAPNLTEVIETLQRTPHVGAN